MSDHPRFPFRHDYPAANQRTPLMRGLALPTAVVHAERVAAPQALLEPGNHPTVLLGSRGRAVLILDLGRESVGWLEVTYTGSTGTLHCRTAEILSEALDPTPVAATWCVHQDDIWPVAGSATVRSHGRRAGRYLALQVDGADVTIHRAALETVAWPVSARGSFTSSDRRLNQVWDLCHRTTALCMQDFYEDGLKRDGMLWLGDFRVQAPAGWACFGDTALARRCLHIIAASQRDDGAIPACAAYGGGHQHPHVIDNMPGVPGDWLETIWVIDNYCADVLVTVRDHVLQSGDLAGVQPLRAMLHRLVGYLASLDGTVDPSANNTFSDASLTPGQGDPFRSQGVFQLQLLEGFQAGIQLAGWMEDTALAVACASPAERLRARLRAEHLAGGIVRDWPTRPGTSWSALSLAISTGVIPQEQVAAAVAATQQAHAVEPVAGMGHQRVLDGLFLAGRADLALAHLERVWGAMLDRGATSAWEHLSFAPGAGMWEDALTSRCHGWSGGPCHLLHRHVLGVDRLSPGGTTLRLRPQLGHLAWAEGDVPTPCGDLHIRVEANGQIEMHLPEGITVHLNDASPIMAGWHRLPWSP